MLGGWHSNCRLQFGSGHRQIAWPLAGFGSNGFSAAHSGAPTRKRNDGIVEVAERPQVTLFSLGLEERIAAHALKQMSRSRPIMFDGSGSFASKVRWLHREDAEMHEYSVVPT